MLTEYVWQAGFQVGASRGYIHVDRTDLLLKKRLKIQKWGNLLKFPEKTGGSRT